MCSVSALQWLCYSDKKDHKSTKRLNNFFTALYRCLRRGARAALQIYPETAEQLDLISQTAAACGFGGGLVVDFPNSTKAKKYFLCLYAGIDPAAKSAPSLPKALGVKTGSSSSAMSVASGATGAVNDDDDVVRAYSRSKARAAAVRGANAATNVPAGADEDAFNEAAQTAVFEKRRARTKKPRKGGSNKAGGVKSKAWIAAKKASRSAKGLATKRDSKYSGRKRGPKF
jgi:Methyltransferase involved in Williams-Beuren syndrome